MKNIVLYYKFIQKLFVHIIINNLKILLGNIYHYCIELLLKYNSSRYNIIVNIIFLLKLSLSYSYNLILNIISISIGYKISIFSSDLILHLHFGISMKLIRYKNS